jgi:hypothetical protein
MSQRLRALGGGTCWMPQQTLRNRSILAPPEFQNDWLRGRLARLPYLVPPTQVSTVTS